ncbi:hypothetical protein [Luedemannella helvata]|uniref:hypothetical protein n=1 Tax=Luedemannella helvata TaxID=349315 RepID=UPI0031D7505D
MTTRVCFDSAAVTAALFGLRSAGVLRVLGRLGASAALASASARLRVGGDRFVIHACATDSDGGRVASAVTGRQECRATGVVTAQVVEQLLRQPPPAGVWHIDQVVAADEFLRNLHQHDLTIHDEI